MTIVNDNYRVVTKLETSLTDDARVVIYYHHMFIVQATGLAFEVKFLLFCNYSLFPVSKFSFDVARTGHRQLV
jgi:hypothetical protein